jgi:hypothetical protein
MLLPGEGSTLVEAARWRRPRSDPYGASEPDSYAASSTVSARLSDEGHFTACSTMARDCFNVSYAATKAGSGVRFRYRISTAWLRAANNKL